MAVINRTAYNALVDDDGSGTTGTIVSKTTIKDVLLDPIDVALVVTRAVGITIDGGGSVISTGVKGFLSVPYDCTITGVRLLSTDAAALTGSIVVDVWKDTYANYPPTVADTITASAKPTLSSARKSEDTTLTGWSKTITAGDVLGFNVDSATTLTRITLTLTVTTP